VIPNRHIVTNRIIVTLPEDIYY